MAEAGTPADTSSALTSGTDVPSLDLGPLLDSAASVMAVAHSATGCPWWATFALAGAGVRFCLTPLAVQQGRALESSLRLWAQAQSEASAASAQEPAQPASQAQGEVSQARAAAGASPPLADAWRRFRELREARAEPSPWWIPAAPVVQVGVFATNAMAVRAMAAGGWPGLSEGGVMWFRDLTVEAMALSQNAAPMGIAGAILPFAVVGVYLANINRAFADGGHGAVSLPAQPVAAWLRPKIRLAMEWLCVGILWVSLQQPQAVLLYALGSAAFALALHSTAGRQLTRRLLAPAQGSRPEAPYAEPRRGGLPGGSDALGVSAEGPTAATLRHAAELRAQGNIAGAIDALHLLVEADPTAGRAFFALGKLYAKQKQWEASESAFMRSAELEADGEQQGMAFLGAGVAMYNQGEFDTAADALGKAAERCPKDSEVWLALGAALSRDARTDDARSAILRASELSPEVKEHLLEGLLRDLERSEPGGGSHAAEGDEQSPMAGSAEGADRPQTAAGGALARGESSGTSREPS